MTNTKSIGFLVNDFHTEVLQFLFHLYKDDSIILYNNTDKYGNIDLYKAQYPFLTHKPMGHFIKDLVHDNVDKIYIVSFDNIIIPEVLTLYKHKLIFIAHSNQHISLLSNLGLEFITLSPIKNNLVNYMIPILPCPNLLSDSVLIKTENNSAITNIALIGTFSNENKDTTLLQTILENKNNNVHLFTLSTNSIIEKYKHNYTNFITHISYSTEQILSTISSKKIDMLLCCPPNESPFSSWQWSGVISFAYNNNIPLLTSLRVKDNHVLQGCETYTSYSDVLLGIQKVISNKWQICKDMQSFATCMYNRNKLLGDIILNRGFDNNELCTSTVFGGMFVLSNDIIGKKVLSGNFHEMPLIQKVASMVNTHTHGNTHTDVILDIGSNIGTTSLGFLKTTNCKVISFEPQLYLAKLQKKTMQLNNLMNRAIIYHNAVGHKCIPDVTMSKTLCNIDSLQTDNNSNCNYSSKSTLNFGGLQLGPDGEEVDMLSIDSLNLSNVAAIKIDVEGAEKLVLWGARDTIRKCKPIIIYESNWKGISQDMIRIIDIPEVVQHFDIKQFLTDCGYSEEATIDDNIIWQSLRYKKPIITKSIHNK